MSNWIRKRPVNFEECFHRRKQLRLENVDEICLHELISANRRLQVKEGLSTNGKSTHVFVKSKEDCLSQNDKLITMRLPVKENLYKLHPNASSASETVDDEELEDLQTEILFGGDYEEASGSEDFTHIEKFSNLVLQDSVKVTQDEDETVLKNFFVQGLGSLPAEAVSINQPIQINQSSQGFSRSNLNLA